MATKHPRLNITLPEEYNGLIASMAKKQGISVSAAAKALLIEAIEAQEDRYLSNLANQREAETTKWVAHKDAWK